MLESLVSMRLSVISSEFSGAGTVSLLYFSLMLSSLCCSPVYVGCDISSLPVGDLGVYDDVDIVICWLF